MVNVKISDVASYEISSFANEVKVVIRKWSDAKSAGLVGNA